VWIWREVTGSRLHTGGDPFPGQGTPRRTHWWDLDLACGHHEVRTVKYRRLDRPGTQGTRRPAGDALPPPSRVGCTECTRNAEREWQAALSSLG
jgi:hypothetical protein